MGHTSRPLVADSWLRSAAAGVEVDLAEAPITIARDEISDYRAAHPLARAFPVLEDVLADAARASDALMAVSDEHGQLLWVCGTPTTLRRAEEIGFVEGSSWDERVAGTNAPGTALTLDRPVQVVRAEHFRSSVQDWSCAAVPIHDLRSGSLLGILDVTGGDEIVVPQTMAMLRAAARLAEVELSRPDAGGGLTVVRESQGGGSRLEVVGLGRDEMRLTIGGRTTRLSPRHSEVLALLIDAERGLSGDEIACGLYESGTADSTVRAELIRLRRVLGDDVLRSRPYRLHADIVTDWTGVEARLAVGDVVGAVRAYRGPLLPHSVAPGVVHVRDRVHAAMSSAVLTSGRADLLSSWTRSTWGADDNGAWGALREALPTASPMRRLAQAQIDRIDAELR
ncbi:helix-turn-helix domain-containing protein [Luteipulveratus halotolerans]|uniref:Transcriptional regulator n=1 Tax=Luteipulveratus halotolerans TaxID=1631356 RepID=A0A0L6CJD2_9MICO|nr:helix-turn-helix domain-containing protein [Luteipulveratus halotolerans]KNX37902.1 transcriptional regulator [Luteipulveratus halotolerans]